ncbi:hypothetical protein COLO4_15674 [Corchorus olitorius]|uniref:Uncharacterized protein n=1 Tax=Corchorus olitorius TaxID=93759 RepID=A0A1R3JLW2_9ROSI|nr:hypothetical protein COLO4_15674 [Corchorus olitorius]
MEKEKTKSSKITSSNMNGKHINLLQSELENHGQNMRMLDDNIENLETSKVVKKKVNLSSIMKELDVSRVNQSPATSQFPNEIRNNQSQENYSDDKKDISEGSKGFAQVREEEIQLEHQSSTETVSSHHPSASNDVLARVMGRDPPGHVCMFGRGVTPSFLWGSNSALKMIEEVKKEAEDQMEMIEKRVKAEMEAKMQEGLQLITNSFYMVLVQIKEKDPDIVIPDIFTSKEPSTSGVGIDDDGDDIYDEI